MKIAKYICDNPFCKEPDSGKLHVRICGGAGLARGQSTRHDSFVRNLDRGPSFLYNEIIPIQIVVVVKNVNIINKEGSK